MAARLSPGRPDLSASDYHADRSAVSKSWLDLIDRSPTHLKTWMSGESHETPAHLFGRLVHSAVLEPDLLKETYAVAPLINRRTKAGKAEYAEWRAENASKIVISDEQMRLALAVRDSVYAHQAARALLGHGDSERTVVWRKEDTGELCKARADWLRDSCVIDVKTTLDARPDAFARTVVNYRYEVSTGHYLDEFNLDSHVFIAVEKDPPYAVAVYATDNFIRERGREARDRNLRTYAECRAKDEWPAYPDVIETIEMPLWAKKRT